MEVETDTLLLFSEEMYVTEMAVHAKYIFINMHEYLDPLSSYNVGLICCNDTCMLLIGSFCFLFFHFLETPAVHRFFPVPWEAAQSHRSQYLFPSSHITSRKRNVIKERQCHQRVRLDGGCLLSHLPLL